MNCTFWSNFISKLVNRILATLCPVLDFHDYILVFLRLLFVGYSPVFWVKRQRVYTPTCCFLSPYSSIKNQISHQRIGRTNDWALLNTLPPFF